MRNKQQGFTLIELVVVIVILGILAAVAVPKFVNLQNDARGASINGLGASVTAAASLVHAKALANTTRPVPVDGGTVAVNASNYPTAAAAGIGAAMQLTSGFTAAYSGTTATFTITGYTPTSGACNVVYDETTGIATVTATGC